MTELARCNGTVLVEDGSTLGLVEQGGGWHGTALFVLVLLAAITGINGGVFLVISPVAGVVLVAVCALLSVAAVRVHRVRKQPRTLGAPWLVFDLERRVLRDGGGGELCALAGLRIERVFQAGSSSKALAIYTPKKLVIARGTPFGDPVDGLEHALRARLPG